MPPASYTPLPDGRFDVSLTIKTEKLRADSLGNKAPRPGSATTPTRGVFGSGKTAGEAWDVRGKALVLRKVKLTQPETARHFVVAEKPAKAGVAPCQKLLERYYHDNGKPMQEEKPAARHVALR